MMKNIMVLILFLIGCSSTQEKSKYEKLLEYEGNYEYVGETTLDIVASELDTTLYAVIDNAKYPLKHISSDSFANNQGDAVIFERDEYNKVTGYRTSGQTFKLITTDFNKMEMFPRKELFHNSDNYSYQKPIKTSDGLETGHLKDEFKNPRTNYPNG